VVVLLIGPEPGGGGPWRDWSGNQDAAKVNLPRHFVVAAYNARLIYKIIS